MKKEKSYMQIITRDNFIKFLAEATPEEVNRLITEKGKPRKLIEPMIFFDNKPNAETINK